MLLRIGKFLFWLGLTAYLGGLASLALAAPIIFNTVRKTGSVMTFVPTGWQNADQLGGEIFGNILQAFSYVEVTALLLMGIGTALTTGTGAIILRRIQIGLLMVITLLTAYNLTVTSPAVWRERTAWREATAQDIQIASQHKIRFDQLHKQSELIGKATLFLLLALLAVASQADVGKKTLNEKR